MATNDSSIHRAIQTVGERSRLERKQAERIALLVTLAFVCVVGLTAWLTDGRVFTGPWNAVMSFEEAGKPSRMSAANCRKPENKHTPYCENRRGKAEASWQSISRHHNGKANAFTLHGKK